MRINRRATTVASSTIALVATAGIAIAQSSTPGLVGDCGYFRGPGMMWGGYGMFFGPLFMLLLLIAVVVGIVFALRSLGVWGSTTNTGSDHNSTKALDILKERFAKGEIDGKEFDERKRLLIDQ